MCQRASNRSIQLLHKEKLDLFPVGIINANPLKQKLQLMFFGGMPPLNEVRFKNRLFSYTILGGGT